MLDSVFDPLLNCPFKGHQQAETLQRLYDTASQFEGLQEAILDLWKQWEATEVKDNFKTKFPEFMGCPGSGARKYKPLKNVYVRFCFALKDRAIPDSWVYTHANEKIPYDCLRCGKNNSQHWNNFQTGKECQICSGVCVSALTSEDVRKAWAEIDRVIPDDWVFQTVDHFIPYFCNRCKKNHQQTWKEFNRGQGCGKCTVRYSVTTKRVREAFQEAGRTIPEDWRYKNNSTLIPFFCEHCESNQKQNWNHFRMGNGCNGCYRLTFNDEEKNELRRLTQQLWRKEFNILDSKLKKMEAGKTYRKANKKAEILFKRYGRSRRDWEHFDHIFPRSIFSPDQADLMNSVLNLRFLEMYENIEKADNIWFEDILTASEEHLSILAQATFLPDYARNWLIELGYAYLLPS